MSPSARATLSFIALFAACGVDDDRSLRYGFSSSGTTNNLNHGGDAGEGGSDQGGTGDASGGGSETSAGSAGDAGGDGAHGGEPTVGGSPPVGGTDVGGSNTVGGMDGGAGPGGSGGSNAGTSGSSGGGNGGSAGMPDDGPCGDIDANAVQDCDETLAQNSRFDQSADAWLADFGITQAWQSADARGKAGSGSVSLVFTTPGGSNNWALAASGQCLPAWSEWTYEVGARIYIPEDQTGRAELSLAAYGNDACAGSYLGTLTPAQTTQTGAWHALSGSAKMPAGTRSVLVRLAAAKPGTQPSFEVQFDDVLFRKR